MDRRYVVSWSAGLQRKRRANFYWPPASKKERSRKPKPGGVFGEQTELWGEVKPGRNVPSEGSGSGQGSREKVTFVTFALYEDQLRTVIEAIEHAKVKGHTTVKSHALSLIALDYLTSNLTREDIVKDSARHIRRFEQLLGFQFLVVNPSTKEIVYASEGLLEEPENPPDTGETLELPGLSNSDV